MRVNLEQRTPEWIEFRKTKIGSSDAAIIMGESPWMTPIELWEEKKGLRERRFTPAMKHGITNEEFAKVDFERAMGVQVFPAVAQHDNHDWMISSIDGISDDSKHAVELKCPVSIASHLIAASGDIQPYYWVQCQHHMAVWDLEKITFSSFFNDTSELVEIARDEEYIKKLIKKEKQFHDCLISDVRPELTDRDYDTIASEEFYEASEKYKELLETIALLEDEKDMVKKQLIDLAAGRNVKGNNLAIKRVISKGRISYKHMPRDLLKELEPFRGRDIESWRVSCL